MRALVTGSSGGIGRAVTEEFIASGFEVIGNDLAEPVGHGAFTQWISGDLLTESTQLRLATVAAEGPLDAVVLAHGIAGSGAVTAIDPESIRRIMRIDFESFVTTATALTASLQEVSGSLVVVSSQAGLIGEANNSIYCAAKFALLGWLRSTPWVGIRPRALCPGAIDTPLLQRTLQGMADAEGVPCGDVKRRNARTTVGRIGRPSDMGAAALWLSRLSTPGLVIAPVTGGEVVA